ncbi:MAG: hypothetical protein H0T89_00820 [Deltaproteobacteria bacterium]|nr:hypothetical protein [Deltaproteobacteria bacterium]MDQ3295839.1 hypothetical protein [Myxococcota bacterium]
MVRAALVTAYLTLGALVACACPSKQATTATTTGSGSAGTEPVVTGCESTRQKVERMYRSESTDTDAARLEGSIADNTAMVMNDCAKAPDKVVACINGSTTIAELEKNCLVQLDDEGTDGEALGK